MTTLSVTSCINMINIIWYEWQELCLFYFYLILSLLFPSLVSYSSFPIIFHFHFPCSFYMLPSFLYFMFYFYFYFYFYINHLISYFILIFLSAQVNLFTFPFSISPYYCFLLCFFSVFFNSIFYCIDLSFSAYLLHLNFTPIAWFQRLFIHVLNFRKLFKYDKI